METNTPIISSQTESTERNETNSSERQHTSVVINNSTSSTSSEEITQTFSLSTIFLPTHQKEKDDGYIDIDGRLSFYDQQNNIFQQLLYAAIPCCKLPFFSDTKLEKYIKLIFSVSFLLVIIYTGIFIYELYHCG